jgi:predicted XRE-type DNA-binding protein
MKCVVCKIPIQGKRACSRKCASKLATSARAAKMAATYVGRFWDRVVLQTSGCRTWQGGRQTKGYGVVRRSGKTYLAHREAYRITYGYLSDNDCVLHECDNPPCCNPLHLFLGSRADNIHDMISKGRELHPSGSENGNSKLTEEQICEIQDLYKTGKFRQAELAERFGVCQSHVSRVVRGVARI